MYNEVRTGGEIRRSMGHGQQLQQIRELRQIKERGFLAVMWPQLISFLVLMCLWVVFLRWYF